jgi:uncharacterized membrane protein YhhN
VTAAAVFFIAAAVGAVADWVAVARRSKALEYVAKPAALAFLAVAAATIDADDGTAQVLIVAACIFCLAGDVFLMLPQDLFVAGLASFLVGHVFYVAGFVALGQTPWLLVGVAIVVLGAVAIGRPVVSAVADRERALLPPVVAYMAVISAMVVTAAGTGRLIAGAGACLFYASDATIAWRRFREPQRWMDLFVIVTYHLGQAALVATLAGS